MNNVCALRSQMLIENRGSVCRYSEKDKEYVITFQTHAFRIPDGCKMNYDGRIMTYDGQCVCIGRIG